MPAPTPTAEELRAEIRRLGPWHQDIEIAPGVRTGERSPGEADPLGVGGRVVPTDLFMDEFIPKVFPDGLAGRSVLDCGCNAGGYLVAAKRHGAGRCFGFDVREHWLNQARFVAQHRPSAGIEFAQCDLLQLRERALEPFDVTFFLGLFYHLPDPMAGLRIAADLTRELIVLDTAAEPKGMGQDALKLNPESDTALMSGVHTLAWLPTSTRVLSDIFKWCGFPHSRVAFVRRYNHFLRYQMFAARDAKTFEHYDRVHGASPRPLWKRALRRLFR